MLDNSGYYAYSYYFKSIIENMETFLKQLMIKLSKKVGIHKIICKKIFFINKTVIIVCIKSFFYNNKLAN